MSSQIRSQCSSQVPGDTSRTLHVSTAWRDTTVKHCLLPVWIAAYRYNGEVYRYVVNGVTGKTHGTAPWSWVKIVAFAVCVVGVVAGGIGLITLLSR